MVECARRQAEETTLDQRAFFLDDRAHVQFLAMLDDPGKPADELRARLKRTPPWER